MPVVSRAKKETADEKAARLQRSADQASTKAALFQCVAILKRSTEAVGMTKPMLTAHDVWSAAESTAEQSGGPKKILDGKMCGGGASGEATGNAPDLGGGGETGSAASDPMASKNGFVDPCMAWTHAAWQEAETKTLKHLLSLAEPVSLPTSNLRAFIKRGSKDVPRNKVLLLFEMEFNLDPAAACPDGAPDS